MTNQKLEKIKPILDFSLVSKFNFKDMEKNSYVPICIWKGVVYVFTSNPTLGPDVINVIESITANNNLKTNSVSKEDFDALLSYVKLNLHIDEQELTTDDSQSVDSEVHLIYDDGSENDEIVVAAPSDDSSDSSSDEKYFSKKLGEVLVQMGLVTNEQIFNALGESKRTQVPLGTVLVQQGIITLNDLKTALTAQQGYEAVTAEQLKVSDAVLSMLPEDFIKINKVLPISYDDKVLVVGMVNPNDKKVINDIIFLTGLKPSILIITHYEFAMCMQNMFNEQKKATSKIIKRIEKQSAAFEREETLFEQAQKELKDDSNIVVKFVNKIISDGIDMKASDIHIEPRLQGYSVRYRKDGILREVLKLPAKSESAILTRLKVISKMNIAEHRRPQDGSFSITYKDRD